MCNVRWPGPWHVRFDWAYFDVILTVFKPDISHDSLPFGEMAHQVAYSKDPLFYICICRHFNESKKSLMWNWVRQMISPVLAYAHFVLQFRSNLSEMVADCWTAVAFVYRGAVNVSGVVVIAVAVRVVQASVSLGDLGLLGICRIKQRFGVCAARPCDSISP